jgi:hypothetical protein
MRLLSAARPGVLDASQRVGSLTATSPLSSPPFSSSLWSEGEMTCPRGGLVTGPYPPCGRQERARRRLAARQRLGRRRR